MHKNLRRIIPVVLLLAALAALGYWYFEIRPGQATVDALTASGTIEITQVQIGAELGGRVMAVHADEGDSVHSGDVLVQVNTELLTAQRIQAEAALAAARAGSAAAQANLALLKAGATAEQILAAQSQFDQADASRQAIAAGLSALTAASRPEDVRAAWERLNWVRAAYDNLKVSLSTGQIEDVRSALTTAQGNLAQAEARKSELEKDSRTSPAALDAAAAAIADAQSSLEVATRAYDALQAAGQPFHAQIEAARISWELAQVNLSQAEARLKALDADDNMIQEALDAAQSTVDDAKTLVDDTQAAYDALAKSDQAEQLKTAWTEVQKALTSLNAMGRGGTTSVESLLNQLDAATALREAASANLANLKNGARPEQLDAAQAQVDATQAQVDAAQAALAILDVQISKLTILSPVDGVVLTRIIQPGELALTGSTLLVLGLADDKTITVYVPEERYGEISLGQSASVSVDSFPGVSFTAEVMNIADQAEFTPRNVQTVEGRKNTVFAIRLNIVDADDRLKAGMPADVSFK